MIFDSHAHLVCDDLNRYPPAPGLMGQPAEDLQRPFTVESLLENMDAHHVHKAVLVQRGSIYGFDNSYVCDSATRFPERLSAVAAIDCTQARCCDQVVHWVQGRGAVGIRLMEPRRGAELSWLESDTALDAWRLAYELDIPVCVHFFRWNRAPGIAALLRILQRWPKVAVVIDHVSNAPVDLGPPEHGLDAPLRDLMQYPRVYLKFTTIPLGALHQQGIDAAALLEHLVRSFGADRLMWGSDVTQSKGTYSYMVELAGRATAALAETNTERVLYGTANGVYGRKSLSAPGV